MKNCIAQKILFFFLIFIFYWLNHIIPFNLDDLNYQWYILPNGNFLPLNSLSDVIKCQYEQYFTFSGRVFVDGIPQIICGLLKNKEYYNIVSAVMIGIWMIMLQKIALPQVPSKSKYYIAALLTFFFWIYNSEPITFYLDVDFGINYLYASLLCLIFLYYVEKKKTYNNTQYSFLLVIAFLAGWSNEVFVIGTGIAALTWLLQNKEYKNTHKLSLLLVFAIAASFLVFAPGNYKRLSTTELPHYYSVLARWMMHGELIIFSLVAVWLWMKKRKQLKLFFTNNIMYIAAWGASILFISAIGKSVYGHMMYGIELFGFICIFRLISTLGYGHCIEKIAPLGCICFVCFSVYICYWQTKLSAPTWEVFRQGDDTNKEVIQVIYPEKKIPVLAQKFVNTCEPLPNYVDHFPRMFNKPTYFYKQSIIDCVNSSNNTIAGDNTLHILGDMAFSKEALDDTISVRIFFGPAKNNLKNKIKRLLNNSPKVDYIDERIATYTWKISPDCNIWQINLPQKKYLYNIHHIDIIQ